MVGVIGPSLDMALDSCLISISSSSFHTGAPKRSPSASIMTAAFSGPDSSRCSDAVEMVRALPVPRLPPPCPWPL